MIKIILSLIIVSLCFISCNKKETKKNDIYHISDNSIVEINNISWENVIKKNIFFGYFEPIEYSFKNKNGYSLYVERFNLSENDIQIIGSWYIPRNSENFTYEKYGYGDGPGIGISFLPNRTLLIFQNGYNRYGQDYYLIGSWKISENKIFCNIEYRIGNIEYEEIAPIQDRMGLKSAEIEKLPFNNDFIEIFTLEKYDFAYVNKKPFEFCNFNDTTKSYLLINDIDHPRYRTLQDEMGCYWDYLDEKYKLGYFMLNNKIETNEDIYNLLKVLRDFRNERY